METIEVVKMTMRPATARSREGGRQGLRETQRPEGRTEPGGERVELILALPRERGEANDWKQGHSLS